jgi:hypothetical protein
MSPRDIPQRDRPPGDPALTSRRIEADTSREACPGARCRSS